MTSTQPDPQAAAPALREALASRVAELEQLAAGMLSTLKAADRHVTYLSNLVSDHTDLRDWDDGPAIDQHLATWETTLKGSPS